jgi:hypothetical protein
MGGARLFSATHHTPSFVCLNSPPSDVSTAAVMRLSQSSMDHDRRSSSISHKPLLLGHACRLHVANKVRVDLVL